ncbi:U-scoloptoxin(05)-Cw1a isoform X1 [Macrosteles quadrilineatus]|uniref:U-scoloptoxin(05)-Cw1a isoform X1 n=1 Tax=Macrosteles quadrilineatus TaxID=74068 RepID=UPI0023E2FD90|nr:U-scoloptoxin(05)-Cw1a isoform X1 [Macrosteles quadrilineatus]
MICSSFDSIFVLCIALVSTINSVSAIDCYQCTSTDHTDPFQCGEYMTDDRDIEPTPCDSVYGAAYCIKHTGRFEGGLGTKRFCSSLDLGNYCNYIRQPGDMMEYRSCVYTCDSDGCNAGNTLRLSLTHITAALTITLASTKLFS